MKALKSLNLLAALGLTALALGALTMTACSSTGEPELQNPAREFPPLENGWGMAIVDYSHRDLNNPQILAETAKADLYLFETANQWGRSDGADQLEMLRGANPETRIIGYINAHGTWLDWGNNPAAPGESYTYDWYTATRPYWTTSTAGDTMMAWPGKVLIDILDPDCRSAMVNVIRTHHRKNPGTVDGFMWDYFNATLWLLSDIPGLEGEADLDGDGIAYDDDPDENEAYRAASVALIHELRAAIGPDMIQITNGSRAALEPEFAALVDGMMYENFPEVGFNSEPMRRALDPAQYNNLVTARSWVRTQNGGPYLILTNKLQIGINDGTGNYVNYGYSEYARVAAMLTGCLVSYHPANEVYTYGWPEVEIDLGRPQGPMVHNGEIIIRDFQHGQVRVEMESGRLPLPFGFEIRERERVVQSFYNTTPFPWPGS